MNKALISAAGPNMTDIVACARPTFEKYAETHGYELTIHNIEDSADYKSEANKAARWARIELMENALETADFVVWVDADIMITDFNHDIADVVPPEKFQALAFEQSPLPYRLGINLNGGVWTMRSNPES